MGRRGLVEVGPALLQGNVNVLGISEHRVNRLRLDLLLVLLNLLDWVGPQGSGDGLTAEGHGDLKGIKCQFDPWDLLVSLNNSPAAASAVAAAGQADGTGDHCVRCTPPRRTPVARPGRSPRGSSAPST